MQDTPANTVGLRKVERKFVLRPVSCFELDVMLFSGCLLMNEQT